MANDLTGLQPLSYFSVKQDDIYIVRFNNTREKYILAALIYQNNEGVLKKIKPFMEFEKIANDRISLADKWDSNIFRIPYSEIVKCMPGDAAQGRSHFKDFLQQDCPADLKLFGSRILFGDNNSDFDFILTIKNLDDFYQFKKMIEQDENIARYDENYFNQRAKQYAQVSCTNVETLLDLTQKSLLYYSLKKQQTEIAFFPVCSNPIVDMAFMDILALDETGLQNIEVEGAISAEDAINSFCYPRVFEITTAQGKFSVYSLLWRSTGVGLMAGRKIKMKAFLAGASTIILDKNSFWEII